MDHHTLIAIFDTKAALADAIGVESNVVRNWFGRGSIPAKYDDRIIAAARARGHDFGPAEMHAARMSLMRGIAA